MARHGTRRLVGRDAEVERLASAVSAATQGSGAAFLVTGEPGIGKTRLAAALAERAGDEATVVWGRCWEGGGAPSFWPWIQCLRALTRGRSHATTLDRIGPRRNRLRQLVPELRDGPSEPLAEPLDAEESRFALFDAVTAYIEEAARTRPLVLILDDLHVADASSLLLLRFLARQITEMAVVVIGTARSVGPDLDQDVLDAMAAVVAVTQPIGLGGLGEADVALLLEDALGAPPDPALATAVLAVTAGNPFFITAVVGDLPEGPVPGLLPIPGQVRAAIAARVTRLPPEVGRVLSAMAVVGRDSVMAVLARIAGLRAEEVLEVLDRGRRAGLVVEHRGEPGRFGFAHGLIRESLYQSLPALHRCRLHGAVADALEIVYGGDRTAHLAELAHHRLAALPAAPSAPAIECAAAAGHHALAALGYDEAAGLYKAALGAAEQYGSGEDVRCDLLLALADAEWRSGRAGPARADFEAACELARRRCWSDRLARGALGVADTVQFGTLDDDANALLQEALVLLERLPPQPLRARVMARLATLLLFDPSQDARRRDLSAGAVDLARQLADPETLAVTLHSRLTATWGPDTLDERGRGGEEIVELGIRVGVPEMVLRGREWRWSFFMEAGRVAAAEAELAAAERTAGAAALPAFLLAVRRTVHAYSSGRWDEHEALVRRTAEIGRRAGDPSVEVNLALDLMMVWVELGRHDDVQALVPELLAAAGVLQAVPAVWLLVARCLALSGRPQEADTELARAHALGFSTLRRDLTYIMSLAVLAELCSLLDRPEPAPALYELLLPYRERNVVMGPYACHGSAARYLGLLAALGDRPDDAVSHLEAAVDHNRSMGWGTWVAYSLRDLGAALAARDRPGDADRAASCHEEATRMAAAQGMRLLAGSIPAAPPLAFPGDPAAPGTGLLERRGQMWAVGLDGRRSFVPHTRGMDHLARLLACADREAHVLDLAGPPGGAGGRAGGGGDPLVDRTARERYRARLAELEAEADEAEAWHDEVRLARARAESDALIAQLAAAAGLSGRDRRTAGPAERARVSVTKAIRIAIARIEEVDPVLGRHLSVSVVTGSFCCYRPERRARPVWEIRTGDPGR